MQREGFWTRRAWSSPKAQASSPIYSVCGLFALNSLGVEGGKGSLSLWHTSCGIKAFRGSEVCRTRVEAFCHGCWVWGQSGKTNLLSYCGHNLWIHVSEISRFSLEDIHITKWKCSHIWKYLLTGLGEQLPPSQSLFIQRDPLCLWWWDLWFLPLDPMSWIMSIFAHLK